VFNVVYQHFIAMYTTVAVRSAVTGPVSSRDLSTSIPKYHVADKHDTQSSHFKLALGQPAQLYALNGERYLVMQQEQISHSLN